jgi:hypothetical protein
MHRPPFRKQRSDSCHVEPSESMTTSSPVAPVSDRTSSGQSGAVYSTPRLGTELLRTLDLLAPRGGDEYASTRLVRERDREG